MSAREITPALLRSWPLPALPTDADKEARGKILVVGGGAETPGAAWLAGLGGLRAGAGKLHIAIGRTWAQAAAIATPEARVTPLADDGLGEIVAEASTVLHEIGSDADAIVIGPGMVDESCGGALVNGLVQACPDAAILVDAAALTGCGEIARSDRVRLVATPHAGEMAKALGWDKDRVLQDPVRAATMLAERLDAVVVMKGETTHIVHPAGEHLVHRGGATGLGTSGSGDVLAGVIGGLLARGTPALQAAAWGVALHGAAGRTLSERLGRLGFLAREILDEIPKEMARLSDSRAGPARTAR